MNKTLTLSLEDIQVIREALAYLQEHAEEDGADEASMGDLEIAIGHFEAAVADGA